MLFHYHFWTPYVEETEKFYKENGFRISQRLGKCWVVDRNERRTFITTPYNFRIELQANLDVIDSLNNEIKIEKLKFITKMRGLERDLFNLFNKPIDNIISEVGNQVSIKGAVIKGFLSKETVDPNGVRIFNNN